ncbi:uncharacterized protein [Coffea arabica]|uniref:Uncharacterized protein isoform X1 n=1 Tax=Coffea arabica TaxID=13443 RepID=A0A6P6UN05_COFAR|nr:uncharacterized protein LOC113712619 isoform X1 [Coffea arabica]
MVGDEEGARRPPLNRPCLKSHNSFNNYPKWKDKLRENCFKRAREDRARLFWELRLSDFQDDSTHQQDIIKSTFRGIVSDELKSIKDSSLDINFGDPTLITADDDAIWDYDGLHTACQGDCEEILLEMQRIFYDDLRMEESKKESEISIRSWDDEEDEYLSHAVYEHMQLNDEEVKKVVWCPRCKRGDLREDAFHIFCLLCQLKLKRGDEVNLELLQIRLAEAHAEHLDRGCRLRPEFCTESRFGLTALYIRCEGCSTFEIVI